MTAVAQSIDLYPEKDLAWTIKLYDVATPTGVRGPLLGATVTSFIATSDSPTATVQSALNGTVVERTPTGDGVYLVTYDRTLLTAATLATAYAVASALYFHVDHSGGIRTIIPAVYFATAIPATVV